jgi:hypothetical protein
VKYVDEQNSWNNLTLTKKKKKFLGVAYISVDVKVGYG